MADIRIPFVFNTDTQYLDLNNSTIDTRGPYLRNVRYYTRYDKALATQRPALFQVTDASAEGGGVGTSGRGILAPTEEFGNNIILIVNDNDVYKDDTYSSTVGTITTGTQRVWMDQLGSDVVLVDPENDEGWVLTSSTSTQISDADFPSNVIGCVQLDGYIFVLDKTNQAIHNCVLDTPASWGSADFITAERVEDEGRIIWRYYDHIAYFGSRSIEFFYNAANPQGSPLNRRQDVYHNIGLHFDNTASTYGQTYIDQVEDDIYFVGIDRDSNKGIYRLRQFQLEKISNDWLDMLLQAMGNVKFLFTILQHDTHIYIALSYSDTSNDRYFTIVYDIVTKSISQWTTGLDMDSFEHIPFLNAERGSKSNRNNKILLINGDVLEFPRSVRGREQQDKDTSNDGYNIDMLIKTNLIDMDTYNKKRVWNMNIIAEALQTQDNDTETHHLEIRWSNDLGNTWSEWRNVDMSDNVRRHLSRLGKFRQRVFEFRYNRKDRIMLEAFELNYTLANF